MKTVLLVTAFAVVAASQAFAQSSQPDPNSLTNQINSVYAAQQQQEAAEKARLAAQKAAREAALQKAERARAAERAAALAIAREKEAQKISVEKDNQHYVDQLRALKIENEKLKLDAKKTDVARENDFVNARLKRENAETDVIQSKADATRNVSSGEKVLLEKTGQAEVKKESGWFK
jgi:poly(A) polymerase Pap1